MIGSELISESDNPADALADLATISTAAHRAAEIVKGLLLFARREDPRPEPMKLESIVEAVLGLKKLDFTINNINAVLDVELELPNCLIDSVQMSQVIVNILNNAQDALVTQKGGGEISIKIRSTSEGVTAEIRDDGPGVEPEMLHKMFEPFYTTKEPGAGTGLGLSICHGIIEQHGGEMWATSRKGSGMTFFVRLPSTDNNISKPKPEEKIDITSMNNPQLVDLTNQANPDEEAVFDLDEVTPDDLSLVRPGAVFRWTIGYRTALHGQKVRVSEFRFVRLPAWSREVVQEVAIDARHLAEEFLGGNG